MKISCPDELKQGIKLFNQQKFLECHEVLEDFWRQDSTDDRQFTQGIIQIAVGYHHATNSNAVGAIKLFKAGLERIRPYTPIFFEVDVKQLISDVTKDLDGSNTGQPITKSPHIFFANNPN